jgi:hypothetical protein
VGGVDMAGSRAGGSFGLEVAVRSRREGEVYSNGVYLNALANFNLACGAARERSVGEAIQALDDYQRATLSLSGLSPAQRSAYSASYGEAIRNGDHDKRKKIFSDDRKTRHRINSACAIEVIEVAVAAGNQDLVKAIETKAKNTGFLDSPWTLDKKELSRSYENIGGTTEEKKVCAGSEKSADLEQPPVAVSAATVTDGEEVKHR